MLLSAVEEAKRRTGEGEKLQKKEELDQVESFIIIHQTLQNHRFKEFQGCDEVSGH